MAMVRRSGSPSLSLSSQCSSRVFFTRSATMSMACSSGIFSHSVPCGRAIEHVVNAMRARDQLESRGALRAQAAVGNRRSGVAFDVDDLLVLHVHQLAAADRAIRAYRADNLVGGLVLAASDSVRGEAADSPSPKMSAFLNWRTTGHRAGERSLKSGISSVGLLGWQTCFLESWAQLPEELPGYTRWPTAAPVYNSFARPTSTCENLSVAHRFRRNQLCLRAHSGWVALSYFLNPWLGAPLYLVASVLPVVFS